MEYNMARVDVVSDMLKYMEHLTATYPDLVEVITIGKSSQGLPLKVLKISTGQRTKKGDLKPAVWIDGGQYPAKLSLPRGQLDSATD